MDNSGVVVQIHGSFHSGHGRGTIQVATFGEVGGSEDCWDGGIAFDLIEEDGSETGVGQEVQSPIEQSGLAGNYASGHVEERIGHLVSFPRGKFENLQG